MIAYINVTVTNSPDPIVTLSMWVSLTDKNCYKIVLAIHLPLGSPDNVFIVMAI